ncbi:MAG: zf-HC2 domain-containing protein [Myxococcota bacterium]
MNCGLVRRYVDAYVDGEMDPSTQIEIEAHLDGCAACQEEVAFVRAVKAQVREEVRSISAPLSLRARIGVALDEVDAEARIEAGPVTADGANTSGGSVPAVPAEPIPAEPIPAEPIPAGSTPLVVTRGEVPPAPAERPGLVRFLPIRPRYAVPLVAAVGLLMVASYTMAPESSVVGASVSAPALEDVVRVHSSELPADVPGEKPQDVVSFFRNRVQFPVRPAEFERREARLVGARLSNVREHRAAALYYDVDGQRMTVVVFRGEPELSQGQRARLLGQELQYHQVNGYIVPVRQRDGVTYAFTGDLDRQALLRLAASARVR